jgi:uncharacterized membrane-anchored protein
MHRLLPCKGAELFTDHPQRLALHNEIHARPPEAMSAPLALFHVVMLADAAERSASREHLASLLRDYHLPMPDAQTSHMRMEVSDFRVRWEMHTEFVTWTFSKPVDATQLVAGATLPSVRGILPQTWLAGLPGQCLCQSHLLLLPANSTVGNGAVRQYLNEDSLMGATVADGLGEVYTDFHIHADGATRMVLLMGSATPRRLGRLVQQLLEIETYRMAALLGLPAAREATQVLGNAERELAALANAIRSAEVEAEPMLLDRLTRLAGQVESQYAASHSRFSASTAYFELVDRRVNDIAESRLAGLQTLGEFLHRRLTPARSTCDWATRRQDALSQRVSRMSNLLRTRVEIEQQQSSQALLVAMNQRQDLQLKLQATVEGLSVAAITYYIVGLISYLAKGAQSLGWPFGAETTAAAAIPLVAGAVWWSLRRMHRTIVAASQR